MKVFSVTELTFAIKSLLEPNFRSFSLQGEISNFKQQSSGHLYFSLKDSTAQISAVLFKTSALTLTRMPKDGDQIVAKGEISLYAPRGQYQIVIRELQFLGQGELLLKLEKLKSDLLARGWFSKETKKPLPKFPKKIGIVTSPTGAVIQDILNVLTRRFSGLHVILNPVKVQGQGASQEIAQAIEDFNKHNLVDVLILGRGGGSIEDLWAFNEEIVAKAIFESKIPIVSAVGHETDFTIADFVADVRAPTPSAAAELVIQEKVGIYQFLKKTEQFLTQRLILQIKQSRQHLEALKRHPLLNSPHSLLALPMQRLDDIRSDLDLSMKRTLLETQRKMHSYSQRLELLKPSSQIKHLKEQLKPYQERFASAMRMLLSSKKEKLSKISDHLHSLNPNNLLKKGYSILKNANGSLISSAKDLHINQPFTVLLHDGRVTATTKDVTSYDSFL